MKNKHNMLRIPDILFAFTMFLVTSCSTSTQTKDVPRFSSMSAEEILGEMTTEEKVAQLFIIRPDALDLSISAEEANSVYDNGHAELSLEMKETMAKYPVGGYIIFSKNIEGKDQLKKLTSDLASLSEIPPIIAVDEEGGRVARLAKVEGLEIKNTEPMGSIGLTGDGEQAYDAGAYIGSYLKEYGFTLDFAPIADVNTNSQNIVIGDRSFGSDPLLVSEMDNAFLNGLHSQGIKGCLKHFPGHGDTKGDTHTDYVSVEKTWEELKTCELLPFIQNFPDADMIMLSHITMTNATSDDLPASLSKELISQKLKGELGYKGIVITDALNMGAIEKHYGAEEAAVMAFEAGNDILLMPSDFVSSYNGILKAVESGRISEEMINETVLRILRFKGL